MSIETPSLLHGLSIAEKVSKLSAFIGEDLDARSMHGMHVAGGCYLLIARSPESPVAQALRSHAARLAAMGIRVRAIFSEVDSSKPAASVGTVLGAERVPLGPRPAPARRPRAADTDRHLHLGRRLHAPRPRQARRPRALRRQLRPDRRPCQSARSRACGAPPCRFMRCRPSQLPWRRCRKWLPPKAFLTVYAASNGSFNFTNRCSRGRCTAPASFAFAAWMQAGATGGNGR